MLDVGTARQVQIRDFIGQLESDGIDTGLAKRFAKAGQWALSFQQVYCAAIDDGDFYRAEQVALEQLNNFFALDPYMAEHLGFPL